MNDYHDAVWRACIRHGLHRGQGKVPMRLYETDKAIYVEIDGETKEFHSRDEVRDFQRQVWKSDSATST